jgi:hypothetical protein
MPTDKQLRALVAQSDDEMDDYMNGHLACEYHLRLKNACHKESFLFARPALLAGAWTNGIDGFFVGNDASGNEIWAHIVGGWGNMYYCDFPHRAVVLFVCVDMERELVLGLNTLAEVAQWNDGVKGDSLVERFRFIYDALVEEARWNK